MVKSTFLVAVTLVRVVFALWVVFVFQAAGVDKVAWVAGYLACDAIVCGAVYLSLPSVRGL